VTVWDPPDRLSYLWHLARDRSDATEVTIRFVASGDDRTIVEIIHTGWERLGADADQWRGRNQAGWQSLMPRFLDAASKAQLTTTDEVN
jgi:hypothetical protein